MATHQGYKYLVKFLAPFDQNLSGTLPHGRLGRQSLRKNGEANHKRNRKWLKFHVRHQLSRLVHLRRKSVDLAYLDASFETTIWQALTRTA